MGKDPSIAEDVQGMFGPTVTGAGPVSVAGVIDRVLSGQTQDAGPVVAEIINRSEQVIRLSTLSSRETRWPPSPYSAQALHEGPSHDDFARYGARVKLTADRSLGYCRLRPFRTHVCVVKFVGEAAEGAEARHGR